MGETRFIGVGVTDYEHGHPKLDHALPDVQAFAGLLAEAFECTVLADPDEQAARGCLKKLRGSMPEGGSLVLLWSGHAIPSPADGLRLLTRDSGSYKTDGLGAASDVAGPGAESGANQVLVIVDTCFSGEAVAAAGVAARILQETPPKGERVWVGVLSSCLPAETARDGMFGPRLVKLLQSGPVKPELLPEYACLAQAGDLVKTTDFTLPELDTAMVTGAMAFHTALRDAEARRPQSLTDTHAIVGTGQPTATTARLAEGQIELINSYRDQDLYGDSTVPIVGACRSDVSMDSNMLRRVPDKHGNLPRNRAALDEMEGILTAQPIVIKATEQVGLRVDLPEFALAGETVMVQVTPSEPTRHAIQLSVTSEAGALIESRILRPSNQPATALIDGLAPGAYTIDVTGTGSMSSFAPVSTDVLVWDPE